MSDYPKAGWNGEVIPGGWDSRHVRPAGEVAGDDLDALDAALAEAERRGAEKALREYAARADQCIRFIDQMSKPRNLDRRERSVWKLIALECRNRADEIGGTR